MALEPRPGAELLEIGCGLALPSLMAARGGSRVLATDSHPEVPRFLERNLARNLGADARANLAYVSLDWQAHWHQADAPSPLGPRRFDRVIGSDILYERKYPPMVARVIDEHLREGGEAIVTDPGRPYLQDLADEMKKRGFACDTQIRPVANPAVGGVREIFVLRFRRGGATNGPGAARADGNTT
jgi:predicted nicotinamide N-methyase